MSTKKRSAAEEDVGRKAPQINDSVIADLQGVSSTNFYDNEDEWKSEDILLVDNIIRGTKADFWDW